MPAQIFQFDSVSALFPEIEPHDSMLRFVLKYLLSFPPISLVHFLLQSIF